MVLLVAHIRNLSVRGPGRGHLDHGERVAAHAGPRRSRVSALAERSDEDARRWDLGYQPRSLWFRIAEAVTGAK